MIIDFNNRGGGGGGTTNYNQLTNKPQVNSVTLSGNTSLDALDIPSKEDLVNGELIVGLTKQIYSPTGTKTADKFNERTTAGDTSIGSGFAQLRSIQAYTSAAYPVYSSAVASVTNGHLTASSTGATSSSYSGQVFTYTTGWTPELSGMVTTSGTAISGDTITVSSADTAISVTIVSSAFSSSEITLTVSGSGNDASIVGANLEIEYGVGANPYWYYGSAQIGDSDDLEDAVGIHISDSSLLAFGDKFVINRVYPVTVTVTEASRENHLTASVNDDTFKSQHSEAGSYTYTYASTGWTSDLATDGISITGTPYIGDVITVVSIVKDYGTLSSATPTAFWATSMNLFNKADENAYESGKAIDASGNIVASAGSYVAKVKVVGGLDDGYVAYDELSGITKIGYAASATATTVETSGATQDAELSVVYPPNGSYYVYVATTDISRLCIHPRWSGYMDKVYDDYSLSTVNIPTTDASGNTLPAFIAVEDSAANEYDFENNIYIKRVEAIPATEELIQQYRTGKTWGVDYVFDSNYIYQVMDSPVTIALSAQTYQYLADDFGLEGFSGTTLPVVASCIYYMDNLVDKLRRDVVTKDELTYDKIVEVSALPTSGVSAGTIYNYNGELYKYVTTSGYCGQWFGYQTTGNQYVVKEFSYAYHLLDNIPANCHIATVRYFTSKYGFVIIDKASETLKVYTATTNDISSAVLTYTIQHNGADVNISAIRDCMLGWQDNHIYFRTGTYKNDYLLIDVLNNPIINNAHYELVEKLDAGQLWISDNVMGIPIWDRYGNICSYEVASSKTTQINGTYQSYWTQGSGFPNFWAPTAAGTSGQVLKSAGSGAPVWDNIANLIGGVTFWTGTQDEYDALETYSNSIVYLIKEDE